jgi:hypothetical protein
VPRNIVRNNVSFDNRVQGFYANHHPGAIEWLNNTAFDNARGFDLINDVDPVNWPAAHYLRNNIAFGNGANLINVNQAQIDDGFNTWNNGFGVSANDFLSLNMSGADGPRRADGGLPDLDFLKLTPGSDLIDAGINVGLPYNGSAPDLGAFETGEPLSGDLNGDGFVGIADLNLVLQSWNDSVSDGHLADPSGDGFVGIEDLNVVLGNWNAGTAPGIVLPEPTALALTSLFGLTLLRP